LLVANGLIAHVAVTIPFVRARHRGLWPLLVAAVVAAVAVWLLYMVWRSPHRTDLATYGAFAVAVLALAAGPIGWVWRRSKTGRTNGAGTGEHLDRTTDLLALAVQEQWAKEAGVRGLAGADPIAVSWGKPSLPMAGPLAAAAASHRFAPLPGLAQTSEADLTAGQIGELPKVYGGLGSGRLVIAGPPGAGKTGAAVLLVLAALQYREQVPVPERAKVPVPVLFTAHDWDPRRQPVGSWLTGRLQETYPLFTGPPGAASATELIAAGKIAVILDGLDEIATGLRPVALQALSEQANFRVVVLSRTAEMASAASQHGMLHGAAAVELRPIGPAEAASYLERVQLDPPPDGWRDLIERLRSSPGSPLSKALDNPLTLTLVRDTYQSDDDARELLDFCDTTQQDASAEQAATEITGHLLDRVLPAAYARRPGQPPPRYDLQSAQNALTKIAARMNQDGTHDLQWWHIPAWAPRTPRVIVAGLVAGFLAGLAGGLVAGLASGLAGGLTVGVINGLAFAFVLGLAVGLLVVLTSLGGSEPPRRIGKLRLWRVLSRDTLVRGLVFGLVLGLAFGVVVGLAGGLAVALVGGLVVGLAGGLAGVLVSGLRGGLADPDSTSSPSPARSWLDDRKYGVVVGLAGGLAGGLVFGLVLGPVFGLAGGLAVPLAVALGFGLAGGLVVGPAFSKVWPLSLAAVQLARQWHTPMHLMRFLEDARERNVLRTVGPVYQFRHARLQDRLAAAHVMAEPEARPLELPQQIVVILRGLRKWPVSIRGHMRKPRRCPREIPCKGQHGELQPRHDAREMDLVSGADVVRIEGQGLSTD
jgi:hypothetical protein